MHRSLYAVTALTLAVAATAARTGSWFEGGEYLHPLLSWARWLLG